MEISSMSNEKNVSTEDFSGFLDGYRARNMAAIERGTTVQLSEIQTRLRFLRRFVDENESASPLRPRLKVIEEFFSNRNDTIVARLDLLGKSLQEMLIENLPLVLSIPEINEQVKGIIKRFVESAEISRAEVLIDTAFLLAAKYTDAKSSSPAS